MQAQNMTQLGSRRIAGASRPVIGRKVQSARTGLTARSPALQSNKPILLQQRKISASEFLRAVVAGSENASPASSFGARVDPTSAMNIVFVAAEVAPWSKTGGLGDVVGGLPIELAKRGHHVMTIAPRYDQYYDGWDTSVVVNIMGEQVRYFHAIKKGVHRVFIDHPIFLAKVWGKTGSKLYGPRSGADFVDNQKRFSLFCKAAIEAVRVLPFGPGENCVFVANDWHSAMVPVLIKEVYQPQGQFKNTKVAFCIHNIAFQGRFFAENFKDLGLPASAEEKFAFTDGYPTIYDETNPLDDDAKPKEAPKGKLYKKLNWMKAAVLTSDKIVTVSPNYAAEITANPQKGVELDHIIRAVGGAEGIVNGMDIEEWNPMKDKFLDVPYDKTTVFAGKAAAKAALQAELGLPVSPSTPLIGYIGRLEEQKGVDIMMAAIPKIAQSGAQIAILGTGKAQYEKMVNSLAAKFPGIAKGTVKFSATLAHLITAGADFILVPSRFEPCGLIQLHAMQYGTVPIVSSTGGLVDTVKEGITGFHMGALDPDELMPSDVDAIALTVNRAVDVYKTPVFKQMVVNCIGQDLSWSKPALKWEGMLEELTIASPEGKDKKNSIATPVATPLTQKAPSLAGASS